MDNLVETVDKSYKKQTKKAILGIFVKQPLPGQVKTRLCPPLRPEQAADLYLQLLTETVERMQQGDAYDLTLCFDGERQWFASRFPGLGLWSQRGNDLGQRMSTAFSEFFSRGYQRVVLIGSDSPDLPIERVAEAMNLLSSVDLVLGPATDGGYYLIGKSHHVPQLFENIPWSSDNVLTRTLQMAADLHLSTRQLESWEDLDDFDALQRYLERTTEGRTAGYLRKHLSHYLAG